VANALGYGTHNAFMKKYCQRIMELDVNAKVALCITVADKFMPLPDKINILFSMWEFNDLPSAFIKGINKADVILVPSRFCYDLFKRYTEKPIYVCWEGIEPETFPFYQRKIPNAKYGEKFRFLWLGAPNPRKGYMSVLEAIKLIEQVPYLEIYIKTTAPKKTKWYLYPTLFWRRIKMLLRANDKRYEFEQLKKSIKRMTMPEIADKVQIFGKYKNIIVDTRKLPAEELTKLYNSAHCFLLPTLGEGWGLTLCEAMATGCPSIATNVTGVREFFNEDVGYEIKYEVKEIKQGDFRDYPDLKTTGYFPDTKDFIGKMIYIYQHYQEALNKGKRASERIHNKFTWDKSALRLKEIIQEHIGS
jgi:hypothetical protein